MAMFLFAAIFIVLFALGTPIAVALGATSLFNIEVFETVSLSSFTKTASNGFSSLRTARGRMQESAGLDLI